MAFPFDTTHLLGHLRATYLAQNGQDGFANRIIKPIIIENDENHYGVPIPSFPIPESPPITFQIARHIQKSMKHNGHADTNHHHHHQNNTNNNNNTNHNNTRRRRRKSSHHQRRKSAKSLGPTEEEEPSEESKPNDNNHTIQETMAESLLTPEVEDIPSSYNMFQDEFDSDIKDSDSKSSKNTTINTTARRATNIPSEIVKFFQTSNKDKKSKDTVDDSSDSGSSINTQILEPQSIKEISPGTAITETKEEPETNPESKITNGRKNNHDKSVIDKSDTITIDSDFGVPVDSNGKVVHNYEVHEKSGDIDGSDNEEDDDDEDEYDDDDDEDDDDYVDGEDSDEFDDDEDDDETSSTDSAFTDIETDSILDSSMLLDSYVANSNSFSFTNQNNNSVFNSKRSRKTKRTSFDTQSLSKTANFKNSGSQNSVINSNKVTSAKSSTSLSTRKNSLTFEKLNTDNNLTKAKGSNLSSLIHTRFKSANVNPLKYFSFVETDHDNVNKTSVDIFLLPSRKLVLKDLKVNENVALGDCIGFILLNLLKVPEFNSDVSDMTNFNPLHWRLELVDEDGEVYGPFGILERNRNLKSYNFPKELGLSKILDPKEINKNEKLSPLAMEFKQNLIKYQQNRDINPVIAEESEHEENGKIQLKITMPSVISTSADYVYYASSDDSVGYVLREFCNQHGLPMAKFLFKIALGKGKNSKRTPSSMLDVGNGSSSTQSQSQQQQQQTRVVKDDEKVSNLESNILELSPIDNRLSFLGTSSIDNSLLNNTITPSDSTFTMNITPDKKQLEEKFQAMNIEPNDTLIVSKKPSGRRKEPPTLGPSETKPNLSSNKYLDDIITGKNPSLPANLNSIYFKWKVWRKKTTILNKMERSLVIDGDYIHLTPSDDAVFKLNPADNPFGQSDINQNHHHHHHYYNYNNYYKQSMQKTSSFHITQIVKLKQYKDSKNPNHFKIVIQKSVDTSSTTATNKDSAAVKKKYDLEAKNIQECQEIIDKLRWVLQVYNASNF
ncbi:hypothetical protein DFJ63DRAFT_333579 [Scheffersomyces coipomensis]|uniref:uncharacterized protein n=1 Tax=Scheffersomyces coipomensis TaxID=1788519 RepID=UPI00315DF22F